MEGFQEDGTIRRFLRFIQNLSVDAIGKSVCWCYHIRSCNFGPKAVV